MVDPRFCQMQVQRQIDVTFATALRAILRQDPDIIMVGEIRDAETAQMAVQAALTGHLVFSTRAHARRGRRGHAAGRARRRALPALERAARRASRSGCVRQICPHCAVEGYLSADADRDALGSRCRSERREQLARALGRGLRRLPPHRPLRAHRRVRDARRRPPRARADQRGPRRQRDRARRARRGHGDPARGRDPQARRRRHHLRRGRARHGGRASEPRAHATDGARPAACARAGASSRFESFEEERALRAARAASPRGTKRALVRLVAARAGFEANGAGAGSLDAGLRAHRGARRARAASRCSTRTPCSATRSRCAGCATGCRELGAAQADDRAGRPAARPADRARARGRPARARRCRTADELRAPVRARGRAARARARPTRDVLDACVRAALGLTGAEAVRVLRKALARGRRPARRRAVAASCARSARRCTACRRSRSTTRAEGLADVGGSRRAQALARRAPRARSATRRARFGLPVPRGLLLLGVQGCGKSLSREGRGARVAVPAAARSTSPPRSATATRSPELAMREAIVVAESLAPVVLWIDEIEKGFAATDARRERDAACSARSSPGWPRRTRRCSSSRPRTT